MSNVIIDDNTAAANTDANAAALAEAVRRAKAEVEEAVAARDPAAVFDAFARKQLADAGWTPEQAAAAAAASSSSSSLSGARWRPSRSRAAALSSSSSSSSSQTTTTSLSDNAPLPPPPEIPPALGVLAQALVAGANSTEHQTRVRAFQASLRRITALNANSGDELAYGITPFAHLTPSEFRRLYLSAPFEQLPKVAGEAAKEQGGGSNRRRRSLKQSSACNARVSFPYGGVSPPSSKDWRNVGGVSYVPSAVRNQQSCGSCASFTAAALLENMVIRKYRGAGYTSATTDVSEQEELDCLAGDGCKGALPYQYLDRAVCRGIAFEASSPYRNYDQGVCPSTASVPRYGSGARAWAEPPANERGVAQAATQGLVAIALLANNDFMYYKTGVFDCGAARGSYSINHATAVVGWNDAVRLSNGATWRVWNVRNSWGTGWGESGYFRLRKDCGGSGTLNMYTAGYNTVLVE
jgi:hypothetical protein